MIINSIFSVAFDHVSKATITCDYKIPLYKMELESSDKLTFEIKQ